MKATLHHRLFIIGFLAALSWGIVLGLWNSAKYVIGG